MSVERWKKHRLAEVVDDVSMGPFGSNLKVDTFISKGVPVIRGANLNDGGFAEDNFVFVSEEKASSLKRSLAYPDDLVFTHRGTIGQVGIVPHGKYPKYLVSQSQMKLTVSKNSVNSKFLYYFFKSSKGQYELLKNASQVGVPAIASPTRALKDVEIDLPPLPTQTRIAAILSALDDKIELNRQTNATLEDIAQAIFKEWFVDFRFPGATGEMQDSELGPIPKGWRVGKLGEIADQRNEREIASSETEELPYVPIDVISPKSLFLSQSKPGTEAKTSLIKFYSGDIIFGAMRPYFHKVCIAPFTGTTRTTAFVLHPFLEDDYSYMTMLLHQDQTIDYASQYSVGSTIPYAHWNDSLSEMLIVLPSTDIRIKFNTIIKPLLDSIPTKYFENKTLTEIRDTLLPKLMNGEISVGTGSKPALCRNPATILGLEPKDRAGLEPDPTQFTITGPQQGPS